MYYLLLFQFKIEPSGSDDAHSYCQPVNVVGITDTIMSEKITAGLNAVVHDVLPLQSKNNKVEKFAVRASTHNIVHICSKATKVVTFTSDAAQDYVPMRTGRK